MIERGRETQQQQRAAVVTWVLRYATLRHVRPSVESGLVWRGEREGMTSAACPPPPSRARPPRPTPTPSAPPAARPRSPWRSSAGSPGCRRRGAQRRRRSRASAESHELRREATVAVGPPEGLFSRHTLRYDGTDGEPVPGQASGALR